MLKLFSFPFIKNVILKVILAVASGPEREKRDNTKTYVWGKVTNKKGEKVEEVYRFMEGYNLTAVGAVECLLKVNNNEVSPGTKTPSLAFGSNFMKQFILE
jgi:short subunit dehydrogenase-like uncharacterized protein